MKRKYDIESKIDYFNSLVFKSELDTDFDTGDYSGQSSFVLGAVKYTGDFIDGLYINIKNKFPDEVLDMILLHELIHIYVIQKYGMEKATEKQGHNKLFYDERDTIMRKFPEFNIPVKEDISGIEQILDSLGY
jgi:hypothetical protein